MAAKLLVIYPTPINAICVLSHDVGWSQEGHPYTNPEGRQGQSFTVLDGTPNRWGAQLTLTYPEKVNILQRGLLVDNGASWLFFADDFTMMDVPPPIVIEPPHPPNPIPPSALTPNQIIQAVYATGNYDLSTKAGCGMFNEECVKQLHERHSPYWVTSRRFHRRTNTTVMQLIRISFCMMC